MATKFRTSDLLGETPAPIQLQLLGCTEFEVGMITGFAAGKTRGICAAGMVHAVKHPGAKVLIGRKTYDEMVKTVKQPAFSMWEKLHKGGWVARPAKWDYREGTHLVRLVNGSQIFFSNLDDPIKFRNEEYSMIIADQVEELTEELWELLMGRIRHAAVPPESWQGIAAANDNGHNWVWRRFVDFPTKHALDPNRCTKHPYCIFREGHVDENGEPIAVGGVVVPCSTRRFFHGTTLDNKHNLAPRYLSVLLSKPKEWQRHFIYATMEGGAGRLLPDPRVVPHFDPPLDWPRYRAVDHALNSPACCLWIAVNTSGAVYKDVPPEAHYVYREYWAEHSSVDQHTSRILALSKGERIEATVMDASAFAKTQTRNEGLRVSIADIYAEHGLVCSPSSRDVWARVERINSAHNAGMAVSEQCQHLIASMPEYQADQDSAGNYKIQNKSDYHAVDALGYGLMIIPNFHELTPGDVMPDYLRDGRLDPVSARVAKKDWQRARKIQELNERELDPTWRTQVNVAEFWGDSRAELVGEPDILGGR